MLSLLPENTLHILDDYSASAAWLEPWRELARTIVFNAEHVFVVAAAGAHAEGQGPARRLFPRRGRARAPRAFASTARSPRSPSRPTPGSCRSSSAAPAICRSRNTPAGKAPRLMFPRLSITALPPMTLDRAGRRRRARQDDAPPTRCSTGWPRRGSPAAISAHSLFQAMRDAASTFGPGRVIIEDVVSGAAHLSRAVRRRAHPRPAASQALSAPGEAVGLLLPNSNGVAMSLLGLLSAGRVAAMINYTAGPANVAAAIRTAVDPHDRLVARLHREGRARRHRRGRRKGRREIRLAGGCARRHHRSSRSWSAALLWRWPLRRQDADQARGHPVHLRLGGHAEGGGAVQPQPRSPMPCRCRRASRCRPRTSCSTCCRCSIPSG